MQKKPHKSAAPQGGKNETSWGKVASWYDELLAEDDSYQKEVILPNLIRLIGPKQGMTMLDLACGQGFFSRALASEGVQVVGVDIAPELIAIGKAKSAAEPSSPISKIKYFTSPADAIPVIGSGSMDVVLITLAIQNIENVQGVFDECTRVLKPGGRLFLVINHPAFRVPKRSSWGWDDASAAQYRRVDAYLSESKEEIVMNPGAVEKFGKGGEVKTVSFHRPLQYFFKKLQKSGFAVSRLEEWNSHKESQAGPRGKEENRIRKEIPLFLCLEAVRGR